jgi:hypothetical protein
MTQEINPADLLSAIENAAHEGDFGNNPRPLPSEAQCRAGNYKLGRVELYGLKVAIERPRHSYRTGVDPKTGQRWTTRLAAHYGHIQGTRGKDGDPVDCFVGVFPMSGMAYVVNQFVDGKFDEHKVMLCFPDEASARLAYAQSFERGWNGLESVVPATLDQLKWWLKNADLSRPLRAENLDRRGARAFGRAVAPLARGKPTFCGNPDDAEKNLVGWRRHARRHDA